MTSRRTKAATPKVTRREDIRNIAIIAHVDHGKTTLVDRIFQECRTFRAGQKVVERVLDSNDLERERGITIFSKNCAVTYRGVKINVIDTPGHADFGGEVERVLKMADGCLLLVDAAEGPLPQTRFVLRKAFMHGLKPIVVLNKIDRPDARPEEVLNQVFDLFIELGATEEQANFPVIYASGRLGYAMYHLGDEPKNLVPLLDTILTEIPGPIADPHRPLQLLVSNIDYSDYVGRIGIGRVFSGVLRGGQEVLSVQHGGGEKRSVLKQLMTWQGLTRVEVNEVRAGDIVALVGLENVEIGDSITDPERPEPLPPVEIDRPTVQMIFSANDAPFRGEEGTYVTSRQLRERLYKEVQKNVALVVEDTDEPDSFRVSGRGILHLGILVETMRREGFEVQVSKPEVITRVENGQVLEPIEVLIVDVPQEHQGKVIELVGARRGELVTMDLRGDRVRQEYRVPSRGLIGLRSKLLNATRGEGVCYHQFDHYGPWRGEVPDRQAGVMVSMATGETRAYALFTLKDRGFMFIVPGDRVYEGQIVGEHCKDNDIIVNTTRAKHLSNVRAAGSDDKIILPPPRVFSVEEALEYIAGDELVELTPKSIRLRKRLLTERGRKRASREKEIGTAS